MTKIQDKIYTNQESPQEAPADFSWESLPELAKERWEQAIGYSSAIENQLAKAKASRTQAEVERQRIATEILSATKEACQAVVADARKTLDKIKTKTGEVERNLQDANRELTEAKSIRAEADAYRETVLARVEQQAEDLLQRARSDAEAECGKLRQQVSIEAQRMMAYAEALRAAARDELEAQRIYAEAAMLKADAHEALAQLKGNLDPPWALEQDDTCDAKVTRELGDGRQETVPIEHPPDQESSPESNQQTPEQAAPAVSTPIDSTGVVSSKPHNAQSQTPMATTENSPAPSGAESPAIQKPQPEEQASPENSSKEEEPHKARPRDRRSKGA